MITGECRLEDSATGRIFTLRRTYDPSRLTISRTIPTIAGRRSTTTTRVDGELATYLWRLAAGEDANLKVAWANLEHVCSSPAGWAMTFTGPANPVERLHAAMQIRLTTWVAARKAAARTADIRD